MRTIANAIKSSQTPLSDPIVGRALVGKFARRSPGQNHVDIELVEGF